MEKKKFNLINFIKSSNGGDLSIVLLVLILCIFGMIMATSPIPNHISCLLR